MSVNLMEMAKGTLDQPVISQIGGLLGESPEKTHSAIGVVLPVLIGGLVKKASSRGGIDEISTALDDQDDTILDNLQDILGGDNQSGMMEAGLGIINRIFGSRLGNVIDLLTNSTGLGGKSIRSLLGLLAPIVASILKRQRKRGGLDTAGLTSLLADQTDNIMAAIPAGLSNLLGLSDPASGADGAAAGVAHGVSDVVSSAGSATTSPGAMFGKFLPLFALVALALIAFRVFRDDGGIANEMDEAPMVEIEEALPTDEMELRGPLSEATPSGVEPAEERNRQ
jgi:hypothetical protein